MEDYKSEKEIISNEDVYAAKQAIIKSIEWVDEDIKRLKMQARDSTKLNMKKWNAALQEMMWTRKGLVMASKIMEGVGDEL